MKTWRARLLESGVYAFWTLAILVTVWPLWMLYAATRPFKIESNVTPQSFGLAYERVTYETSDGIALRGWFIPRRGRDPATERTLVLLHGYPADKGNIFPSLAFLADDYNLFLFDFRYHGESGGKLTTGGAREREDLLAALRYLRGRGIAEVGVWGFSMGGAVALLVAPDAPEIRAVAVEAPYARLSDILPQLYPIPVLRHGLAWLTRFWGSAFLGLDAHAVAPEEAAARLRIPALLIHSQADIVIPFSHAKRLEQALRSNPQASFWFPEAILHGWRTEEHNRRVREFFLTHFPPRP
jgi:pimeloyl-ACP methyl ester carboxylesterase